MSTTLAYLHEKYGVTLTFEEAAAVLKYPSLTAAKSARQRGTFPIPIRRAGDRHLCSSADMAAFLEGATQRLPRGRPRKEVAIAREQANKAPIASTAVVLSQNRG